MTRRPPWRRRRFRGWRLERRPYAMTRAELSARADTLATAGLVGGLFLIALGAASGLVLVTLAGAVWTFVLVLAAAAGRP